MAKSSSELFKILSVDARINIIELLKKKGPLCVNVIAKSLGVTQSAISQHLRILKSVGLVNDERRGYWIHYSLNRDVLEKYRNDLDKVCTCGCQGFIRTPFLKQTKEALEEYKIQLEKELERVKKKIVKLKKT